MHSCGRCSNRLPENAEFCPRCGLQAQIAPGRLPTDPSTDEFTSPFPKVTDWQLLLVRPDGEQLSCSLTERLTIGRSPDSDLQLQDSQVSRVHAVIEMGGSGFTIADLGSSNGTYLNRKRVHTPVRLRVGDTITLGQHRLLVQREKLTCGNCARPVRTQDVFCMHCGQPLSGLSEPSVPPYAAGGLHEVVESGQVSLPESPGAQARHKFPENLALPKPERQNLRAGEMSPDQRKAPATSADAPAFSAGAPASSTGAPSVSRSRGMKAPPAPPVKRRDWLRTCAVAAVTGLCLAAAASAAVYWYLTASLP